MSKLATHTLIFSTMFFVAVGSHATSNDKQSDINNVVGCAIVNEGYLDKVPGLKLIQPTKLKAQPERHAERIFKHDDFSLSLTNAIVVTHTLQKPFISSFGVQVDLNGTTFEARSSVRQHPNELIHSHLTLSKKQKQLVIECSTQ